MLSQSVSLSFFPVPWGVPAVPVLLGAVFMGWLVTLFAGWVFVGLFPQRLVRVATTASQRTVASFFVGLASIPGFFLLLVLLFVTVIGIPLACLLPIAYTVLQYAGQIAATYVLGCRLTNRPGSALLRANPASSLAEPGRRRRRRNTMPPAGGTTGTQRRPGWCPPRPR